MKPLLLCVVAWSVFIFAATSDRISEAAQTSATPIFASEARLSPQIIAVDEPLRLDMVIRYNGATPLKVYWPFEKDGMMLKVRRVPPLHNPPSAGTDFFDVPTQFFYTGAFVDYAHVPNASISRGASTSVSLKALYDFHNDHFVFDQPGAYDVIITGEILTEADQGQLIAESCSNRLSLTVAAHEGKDRDLWRKIVGSGALSIYNRTPEQTQLLLNLSEQFPQSPYRPYVLAMLGGAFARGTAATPEERQQRRAILEELLRVAPNFAWKDRASVQLYKVLVDLGEADQARKLYHDVLNEPAITPDIIHELTGYVPSILFPQDNRLDRPITSEFRILTPLEEVLNYFSHKSGVPLTIDDSLKKQRLQSMRTTRVLREEMLALLDARIQWIRDGNGYRLVPKPTQ